MQRVKVFIYVSLGILALAAAFHLGASAARSQTANQVTVGSVLGPGANPDAVAVDQQGLIWTWSAGGSPVGPLTPPKPGRIAALNMDGNGQLWILFEDGDVYHSDSWITNLFANGPVPATKPSWGRVKADRR